MTDTPTSDNAPPPPSILLTPELLHGRYAELALAVNMTRSHMSRVLRGDVRRPSLETAEKIVAAVKSVLGVEVSMEELKRFLAERQAEAVERAKRDSRPHVEKIRAYKRKKVPVREIERLMRAEGMTRGVNRQTISSVR